MTYKLITLEAAVQRYTYNGMQYASGAALPVGSDAVVFGRELLRQQRRELHAIFHCNTQQLNLLAAAGAVALAECGFTGLEGFGFANGLRRAVESGAMLLEDYSNLSLPLRLLGGAFNWPFVPVTSNIGSDLQHLSAQAPGEYPAQRKIPEVVDPFSGRIVGALSPLRPDLAAIHVTMADIEGNAISINGGKNNGAVGNDMYDIGRSGVVLQGGDRITLTPAGNHADNNHIHHMGVCYKQGVGVELTGCGNRASQNLIHDGPRFGILFMGNNHVIEYNHLHHLCLETEDTGAMYTGGRDWISARGTVLRYNFIHDIYGFGQEKGKWVAPFFAWGIYLDDNTGGVDVIGNVIARCSLSCLHLHDGRDNLIQNNIFVGGGREQITYNGWTSTNKSWTKFHDDLVKGYDSIKDQPAWKGMRNIGISPDQSVLTNGMVMIGNEFYCNIIDYPGAKSALYDMKNVPFDRNAFDYDLISHHGVPVANSIRLSVTNATNPSPTWEGWHQLGNDKQSVISDPLFANPAKDDFRIATNSPAYQLGFKTLPLDKIGPYQDELRASWPIKEE